MGEGQPAYGGTLSLPPWNLQKSPPPPIPCLPQVPVWVLQQDATAAHNSRLTAFAGCGTTVATGSAVGGVKVRGVVY